MDAVIRAYKRELAKGREVEKEHSPTVDKLNKKDMTPDEIYESIAKDHLDEHPDYYTRLLKAKL